MARITSVTKHCLAHQSRAGRASARGVAEGHGRAGAHRDGVGQAEVEQRGLPVRSDRLSSHGISSKSGVVEGELR